MNPANAFTRLRFFLTFSAGWLLVLMWGCGATNDIEFDTQFDFVHLDTKGEIMPFKTGPWACVQDNGNGLVWEVKADNEGLRHYTATFSWFNPSKVQTRDQGIKDKGSCHPSLRGSCDTQGYVAAMNKIQLCGRSNWRLPTRDELASLLELRLASPGPLITPSFPNTKASGYWTQDEGPPYSGVAWALNFSDGQTAMFPKNSAFYVRLVSE